MLKTGNKGLASPLRARVGFTFLEIMVASVALALGTVVVYEAFFVSLDAFNYYADYLNVSCWADNKIWQAQDYLRQGQAPDSGNSGEFKDSGKVFRWNLNYNLIDELTRLYELNLQLSWKTGRRESNLSRNTYGILQKK